MLHECSVNTMKNSNPGRNPSCFYRKLSAPEYTTHRHLRTAQAACLLQAVSAPVSRAFHTKPSRKGPPAVTRHGRKTPLTQSFDKLHKAHDVTRGCVGEDLDVVGVEESFEHIKHWSLAFSLRGEGCRIVRALSLYPSGCPYSQHFPWGLGKDLVEEIPGLLRVRTVWLQYCLSQLCLQGELQEGHKEEDLGREMKPKAAECRAEEVKHAGLWDSPAHITTGKGRFTKALMAYSN